MKQNRLESFIEVNINVAIGFMISLSIGELIIMPLYSPQWTHFDNLIVTLIYTVAAIIRGYVVRRFFNAELHKQALRVARWLIKLGLTKD